MRLRRSRPSIAPLRHDLQVRDLRLGSPIAAEDVTSQIFLGMIRGLSRYRDEGKPFIAWLYGIAQKQIAFFQRGHGRQPSPVDLDDGR